jgi:CHAT domain-containing protein/Tfp pilus assembly protein PilF
MRICRTYSKVAVVLSAMLLAAVVASTNSVWRLVAEAVELRGLTQGGQDIRVLEPGKPIEQELAGGQVHTYQITLGADQFLHVVVDQRGIDVVVKLFGPDGKQLAEVDSPNGTQGPEPVSVVVEASGSYRLEISSLEKVARVGLYDLRIIELRAATPQDRSRVAAHKALWEAGLLLGQMTEESRRRAIEKFKEVLSLSKALGDRLDQAHTLVGLGKVHYDLGEYQQALDFYYQALSLVRSTDDRRAEANSLSGIGTIYSILGEHQKALDSYNQALLLWRAIGDRGAEVITLNNIGAAYSRLGQNQQSLKYHDQALLLIRAMGRNENWEGADFTLARIGRVYRDLGEPQKALEYFNQALPLSRGRLMEANILSNIGVIHSDLGEPQKALEYFNQALQLRRIMGDRRGEAETLTGVALVERNRGNLIEARTQIELALNFIESLRAKVASQELRSSYFASVQDYYTFYTDLLMRLHQTKPTHGFDALAVQANERARARVLLEQLSEARAEIRQGVDPVLLERERILQRQLNAKASAQTQLLSGKHTEAQAAAIAKEIEELTSQYQQVEAQIRATSPPYAAFTQPQGLALSEIQQLLDSDTLLLEYSLGKERSYLWAVTPTSITSHELPKRTEIDKAAGRVHELLTISHRRETKRPAELAAAELSQLVLGPVAALLGNKRLLIVADGALQYVPFGALPKPATDNKTTDRKPLIADHEVVHLPSASTLAVLRREMAGRQSASKTVAVLADPVLLPDDVRVKQAAAKAGKEVSNSAPASDGTRGVTDNLVRSAKESGVMSWERLPFSRQEAEAIAQMAQKQSFKALDFEASRTTATNPELSQYRIVHFATHGLLNSQHPELSGLVLSLVDERGQPQDGFLRLHDVYNLKLNADLVVLSACQTALGKEIKGEGLVGLTRGFMYAGAPRVVASLWSVRDEATAELMKRFYRGMLKEGLRPPAALRAAQLSMWKEKRWEAPYYWAGFVLQGEWR